MNTIETVPAPAARVTSRVLSSEDLRRIAPSVFAETARPGVSSRYAFVSTAQVVALLQGEGWEPVKASEQRVRLVESRQGFQMHELRFARRVDLESATFNVGIWHDVLWMSRVCRVRLLSGGHTFKVGIRIERTLRWHELKILFHDGDYGEPCATVMLPEED